MRLSRGSGSWLTLQFLCSVCLAALGEGGGGHDKRTSHALEVDLFFFYRRVHLVSGLITCCRALDLELDVRAFVGFRRWVAKRLNVATGFRTLSLGPLYKS
jgi:hypothetical protein